MELEISLKLEEIIHHDTTIANKKKIDIFWRNTNVAIDHNFRDYRNWTRHENGNYELSFSLACKIPRSSLNEKLFTDEYRDKMIQGHCIKRVKTLTINKEEFNFAAMLTDFEDGGDSMKINMLYTKDPIAVESDS